MIVNDKIKFGELGDPSLPSGIRLGVGQYIS